ncbi:MAG: chromophore lyase CpcT/CpeT [Flavobacteriales bacterium]
MQLRILLPLLATLAAACSSSNAPVGIEISHNRVHLDRLQTLMTGHFTSAAQSATDSNYVDITLHMNPIWASDSNRFWLYVEQAATSNLDRPYRQRVYAVQQLEDSVFRSDMFNLPVDSLVIGFKGQEEYWDSLHPDSLTLKQDCEVYLALHPDGTYQGSTKGKGCSSTLYGASYATSEVTISADQIQSWDRGLDSLDVYIWGAEYGPYIFDRQP